MKPNNALIQADDFMDTGQNLQAASIIERVLSETPSDTNYADAAATYLIGHMYDEAISAHERYQKRKGKSLDAISGFKLADIQQEKAKY
jgi:hypothetical protein